MKKTANITNIIRNKLSCERGQIAVIACFVLVVAMGMMAFVIDEGSIYQTRRNLQTIADSAALAGAQELTENPGNAVQKAIEYAANNNFSINADNVTIFSTFVTNDTITINITDQDTPLFFANFAGVDSVNVPAQATATVNGPGSMTGLMPWAVPVAPYGGYDGIIPGEIYALKLGSGTVGSLPVGQIQGNFQAMAFDGGGASDYRDNIENGCSQEIFIGNYYPTEPGNMTGPTRQGINSRIGSDSHSFFDGQVIGMDEEGKYYIKDETCPRVIYVPIVDTFEDSSGREDLQIIKFSVFFLESYDNNNSTVFGRFVDYIQTSNNSDASAYTGGVKIIRLVGTPN
jgi:Flp pilus assembly protein TadG